MERPRVRRCVPKNRCPFDRVPVIIFASFERLWWRLPLYSKGAAQDDDGLGARQALGRHLGGHIHHAGAADLIDVGEDCFFHVTR